LLAHDNQSMQRSGTLGLASGVVANMLWPCNPGCLKLLTGR
jgi:hypothetical protein